MRLSFTLPSAQVGPLHTKVDTNDTPIGSNWLRFVPHEQIDAETYRFTPLGGCPVSCRASVVRICFMKLLGLGILAAYMATAAPVPSRAYSCALAAGVNSVAVAHYALIWSVRAQVAPSGYEPIVSKIGSWSGGDDQIAADGVRLLMQEQAVDGARFSDWTVRYMCYMYMYADIRSPCHVHALPRSPPQVTLVLMTIDLWHIADLPIDSTSRILGPFWCASLQPVMILLASVPRFYLGEFRGAKGKVGEKVEAQPLSFVLVGIVAIVASCAVFVICAWDIVTQTLNHTADEWDRLAVLTIVLVQVGYPVVFIGSILYLHLQGYGRTVDTYPAYLSFFKDSAYGTLDVFTKGGLALYVAVRAMEASG